MICKEEVLWKSIYIPLKYDFFFFSPSCLLTEQSDRKHSSRYSRSSSSSSSRSPSPHRSRKRWCREGSIYGSIRRSKIRRNTFLNGSLGEKQFPTVRWKQQIWKLIFFHVTMATLDIYSIYRWWKSSENVRGWPIKAEKLTSPTW